MYGYRDSIVINDSLIILYHQNLTGLHGEHFLGAAVTEPRLKDKVNTPDHLHYHTFDFIQDC